MIRRIRIRDFKSIRDVTLDLEPVTVLVGRSGVGKSNLVQAIRFLRNHLLNVGEAVNFEGGWPRIVPAGLSKPATSLEVVFSLPGEEGEYTYRFTHGMRGQDAFFAQRSHPSLVEEYLSLGADVLFHREHDGGQWKWLKAPELANVPGMSDGPMLGAFPALQKVVYAFAALSTGIGCYHFPSSVLGIHDTQGNGSATQLLTSGLQDDGRNHKDALKGIIQDFQHPAVRKSIMASLQSVNASVLSVELDSLSNPGSVIVGHEAAKVVGLSLEQESDGFRRFYVHLLALYQSPPKLTLLFEEPENAIFPGALSLLAEEFKAAPGEGRGQIIVTTHSPGLLDSFDVACVRVVDMVHGETKVGPVAADQAEAVREQLLKTGELLTVTRPRMEGALIDAPEVNQA